MVARTATSMVRHIMMAMTTINRFAALPRWSTTVSADARPKTLATTMEADPEAGCGAKHRFVLQRHDCTHPVQRQLRLQNKPAAALKSP